MLTLRFSPLVLAFAIITLSLASRDGIRAEEGGSLTEGSYRMQTSVIGSAGSPGVSPGYRSRGTFGQPTPIGVGSATEKTLYAGFWSKPWILASVPESVDAEDLTDNLFQNFPNPFTHSTTIAYTLTEEVDVDLTIFNVNGQVVSTVVDGSRPPGRHIVIWDGKDEMGRKASPGVYFYRMRAASYRCVKKMIILK